MELFPKERYWYNGLLVVLVLVNGFILYMAGYESGALPPLLRDFVQPLLNVPFVENLHQSTDFGAAATACVLIGALSSTFLAVFAALFFPTPPRYPDLGKVRGLILFAVVLLLCSTIFFFGFMDPDEIKHTASKSGRLFAVLAHSKLLFGLVVAAYFSWFHFFVLNQTLFRTKLFLSKCR